MALALMSPADNDHGPSPRYGMGDDEKTRPCAVLFDWEDDDDDKAIVHALPIEHDPALSPPPTLAAAADVDDLEEIYDFVELDDVEELDDIDVRAFRPRWRGIGRLPGTVALAIVLVSSVTIGALALFGAGSPQAEAAAASSLSQH
jgi:hypothetical protein